MESATTGTSNKQPKPKKDIRGECPCPVHRDTMAAIKKTDPKSGPGKFYLDCPECGLIMPTRPGFQDYILDNGKFFTPGDKPPEEKQPAEVVSINKNKPKPKDEPAPASEPEEQNEEDEVEDDDDEYEEI